MDNVTTYRKDYKPFSHNIDSVELDFTLDPNSTEVKSTLTVTPRADAHSTDLVLNGEELQFVSVAVDGVSVPSAGYRITDKTLTLHNIVHQCKVQIVNRFSPARNKALSGIYMSHGAFMSQCEAEGFRRITYWPDRPDVMSLFTVTIHADKTNYPVMLSNGNLVDEGDEEEGRHFVKWSDPFKKPCYLFALIAGVLVDRSCNFTLKNGKEVLLQVWTEKQNYEKSAHALESLKKAIRWDEERFGLELDLDRFMIVATDDFNFGAMENKGLNVFNSRYVMATPQMATDADYSAITSVVGHEYFHNWTGDRVTLRDWFQLTLKEGLTVFRDQEFDMDCAPDESARAVKRIKDVRALRARQFPEDAGPMAHPIRPDSYQSINNFYTMTVYEKGAEVIRMLQTILGKDGFKKGLDLYFKRHDGTAVTCDDFIAAMADANKTDLSDFSRWWSQSGTPCVTITTQYDPTAHRFTVKAQQTTPPTADQKEKQPLVIPISVGLLDQDGHDIPLVLLDSPNDKPVSTRVLLLTEEQMSWTFTGINTNPVISIGRGFSAPVIFDYAYTKEELSFLARHDSDAFNRAEAMERLALEVLGAMVDEIETGADPIVEQCWLNAFEAILKDESLSPAFQAVALALPSESTIAHHRSMVNPDTIHRARNVAKETIGNYFSQLLSNTVCKNLTVVTYDPNPTDAGKRAIKNLAMDYWLAGGSSKALLAARDQFDNADNLTDRLAALCMIVNSQSPAKEDVLNTAARAWLSDPLLMNKWFTVQALADCYPSELPVVERIKNLMSFTEVFSIENPNNVYALINAFFTSNPAEFHRLDGSGYEFWVQMVTKVDTLNPHVAGRLARALDDWRRFEPARAKMMYEALLRVSAMPRLSSDVREIISKSLNQSQGALQ